MDRLRSPNSNRKKVLFRIVLIVAALLAVVFAAYLILSSASKKNVDLDYDFYEPDYTLTYEKMIEEPDYAERGWYITYTNDAGESVAILDDDYLSRGIGVELLSYYFAAIQSGDAQTYNSLFGDEYISVNGRHDPFTPQRIYDINVRFVESKRQSDDSFLYKYEIGYKIMRNDGTFTRLIGSDMSRPQYITIYSGDDDVYIKSVDTTYKN